MALLWLPFVVVLAFLLDVHGNTLIHAKSLPNSANTSLAVETVHGAEINSELFAIEDLLLTSDQLGEYYNSLSRPVISNMGNEENTQYTNLEKKSVAISGKKRRWPKGVIRYKFTNAFSGSKSVVKLAMRAWEKHTCVKFEELDAGSKIKAYLEIGKGTGGCKASVGYTPGRKAGMYLGSGCSKKRVVMHELGHVLGLYHEHMHPDRNNYIKILWDNIIPSKKAQLKMRTHSNSVTLGFPYDPLSIMHYSKSTFTKSGKLAFKTIDEKTKSVLLKIGKVSKLSPTSDIPMVKKMYECE